MGCFIHSAFYRKGNTAKEGRTIPLALVEQRASLVAQLVKNQPAMQETQVRSLGQEDPLEREMATHSSILAWEIPWTEEPGGLQSWGRNWTRLSMCTHIVDQEPGYTHFWGRQSHSLLIHRVAHPGLLIIWGHLSLGCPGLDLGAGM